MKMGQFKIFFKLATNYIFTIIVLTPLATDKL